MDEFKLFFANAMQYYPTFNLCMGLVVYGSLKISFLYGKLNYGRDGEGNPRSGTDWVAEFFQFLLISQFWFLAMFVRLPYFIEGFTLPLKLGYKWIYDKTKWWRMTPIERRAAHMRKRNEMLRRQLAADLELENAVHARVIMTQKHIDDVSRLHSEDLPDESPSEPFSRTIKSKAAVD